MFLQGTASPEGRHTAIKMFAALAVFIVCTVAGSIAFLAVKGFLAISNRHSGDKQSEATLEERLAMLEKAGGSNDGIGLETREALLDATPPSASEATLKQRLDVLAQ
jgi:hypothetical protein